MSRLEKAREKKRKGRKKFYILMFVVQVIVILAALILFLHYDDIEGWFRQGDAELIDMERSIAFIDLFELTYVRIYLLEEVEALVVTVNGEELTFNKEYDRWELVTGEYGEGDELLAAAVSAKDDSVTQEAVLIVEGL